jgi:hypothetical protein
MLDGRNHKPLGISKPLADQVRHIASARHPIPDVPVLYLVEPTSSNLQAITSDLKNGLYSPAYINFLSSIPRPLLEDFAQQTSQAETSDKIAQFYDQFLNFIVGEPDLFSLGMQKQNTYWALNSARTQDDVLDAVIDRAVSGLFSVMVTMGMESFPSMDDGSRTNNCRCYAHHKVPERSGCGNDSCEA